MNAVNKLTFINENQKSRGSIKRRKQRACSAAFSKSGIKAVKMLRANSFPPFFSVINAPATTRLSFRKPNV